MAVREGGTLSVGERDIAVGGDKIVAAAVPSGGASVEGEGGGGVVDSTSNGGAPRTSGEGGVGVPFVASTGVLTNVLGEVSEVEGASVDEVG